MLEILLDSCQLQLLHKLFLFNAAAAAVAVDDLSSRNGNFGILAAKLVIESNSRYPAYLASVALIGGQDGSMYLSAAHELIAHNGNIAGHGNTQFGEFVDKAVSHMVVGTDDALRQFQFSAGISHSQILTRIHPEIAVEYLAFVKRYAVGFQRFPVAVHTQA